MGTAACPRCAGVVALHEGRPYVTAHGSVELWHRSCWDVRDTPLPVAAPVIEPIVIAAPIRSERRRTGRTLRAAIGATAFAGSAALALVLVQNASARADIAASNVNVDVTDQEGTSLRARSTVQEIVPPEPPHDHLPEPSRDLESAHPIPVDDGGKPLDEKYKTLRDWVHPITAAAERFPWSPGRHFGAHRNGIDRAECGEGHCGVDLDGPRGRPLVAVSAGVLVVVERRERGGDGLSGRFVRIQHGDGTLTSYMHMDEVDADLQVGDHVEQGQYLGTLGSTAVSRSVPHVHFALEIPASGRPLFIDPAPFLVRARIADVPERRHPIKPAF
jgi:murein DD-endopeptidase MepM/ murein hydrolase activator NlpD